MKKNILAVILVLGAFFFAYGQNSTPIDLILLLDTSSGMGASNETVNNYITGAFLSEFLRLGDTFHLIAFSSRPRADIARRIESRGDVETIIGRMLLQYPLESGSDIRAALGFAEDYIASLPSRPKKIVVVSTGGLDQVNAAKQRFNAKNASLDFVQAAAGQPLSNLPSSGRSTSGAAVTAGTQTAANPRPAASASPQNQTQPSAASTPQSAGVSSGAASTQPAAGANPANAAATSAEGQTAATDISAAGSSRQTGSAAQDESSANGTSANGTSAGTPANGGASANGTSTNGTSAGSTPADRENSTGSIQETTPESRDFPVPLFIVFAIVLLLALAFLVFFVIRNLRGSPGRAMAMAASAEKKTKDAKEAKPKTSGHGKELAHFAAAQSQRRTTPYSDRSLKQDSDTKTVIKPDGPLLLNLFVEEQNTAIGRRNVHSLKSGYSLTVGGGDSDFLIFLVPLPPKIGEIRREGSRLTFIPHKPKYFPDIGSNEVRDCINMAIRIISDKDYELHIRFELYEDPLIALNRMLNSLKVPG